MGCLESLDPGEEDLYNNCCIPVFQADGRMQQQALCTSGLSTAPRIWITPFSRRRDQQARYSSNKAQLRQLP